MSFESRDTITRAELRRMNRAGLAAIALGAGVPILLFTIFGQNPYTASVAASFVFVWSMFIVPICAVGIFRRPKLIYDDRSKSEASDSTKVGVIDSSLTGKIGTVVTPMNPCGTISIGGEFVEAPSEDGFLDRGVDVVIIAHRDRDVAVRKTA